MSSPMHAVYLEAAVLDPRKVQAVGFRHFPVANGTAPNLHNPHLVWMRERDTSLFQIER